MRRTVLIAAVSLWMCAACKSTASSGGGSTNGSKKGAQSAKTGGATGEGQSSAPSATGTSGTGDAGQAQPGATDAGTSPSSPNGTIMDGGHSNQVHDGGTIPKRPSDAAVADATTPDAGPGMLGTGSCCEEHTTPGCGNADLQVCVCEKIPACCTTAWNTPCVLIVKEKYCQPGVRDCVCGTDAGQWGQTSCCDTEWSDTFCNQVAETKCGAVAGCF